MDRRAFVSEAGLLGMASLGGFGFTTSPEGVRDFFELRRYEMDSESQVARFVAFMRNTAIPALNRLGVSPVGVFLPVEEIGPVTVLLRHTAPDSVALLSSKLLQDEEFLRTGAEVLDASSSEPAYRRLESSLLVAFEGMPRLETPIKSGSRVFQLRIYESPSLKTGRKKIEMFNRGELDIFRRTGLNPVFFGETLVGLRMPNLTYMLVFENDQEREAAWKRFVSDPEWKELSSLPEYADKKILSGITNLLLRPAEGSQV